MREWYNVEKLLDKLKEIIRMVCTYGADGSLENGRTNMADRY